jgi:hypothetical protein
MRGRPRNLSLRARGYTHGGASKDTRLITETHTSAPHQLQKEASCMEESTPFPSGDSNRPPHGRPHSLTQTEKPGSACPWSPWPQSAPPGCMLRAWRRQRPRREECAPRRPGRAEEQARGTCRSRRGSGWRAEGRACWGGGGQLLRKEGACKGPGQQQPRAAWCRELSSRKELAF